MTIPTIPYAGPVDYVTTDCDGEPVRYCRDCISSAPAEEIAAAVAVPSTSDDCDCCAWSWSYGHGCSH